MSNNVQTDIAVIKNSIKNIEGMLGEMKTVNKEFDFRITSGEKAIAGLEQKVSIFALFQGSFSVVVGAIAAFLGASKK